MSRDADVIIVGAGGAGMSAAIEAADRGASVVVLESAGRAGGSTAVSGGVYCGACTSVQREAQIEDSIERMYRYYMTLNQWNLTPGLMWRLCEQSGPTLDWLIGLGVRYPASGLCASGVDPTLRGHVAEGGGLAIFEALNNAASSRGVETHLNIRVESLVQLDGRIVGISAQGSEMRSGAVILACGGFGANPQLVAELFPSVARHGDQWVCYYGPVTNRGDGLVMGRAVNAAIVGRDRGCLQGTPGFFSTPDGFLPPWLVYVNLEGRRFMDETCNYAVSGDLIKIQTEGRCFCIIDEPARVAAKPDPSITDKLKLGLSPYNWVADTILAKAKEGKVIVAETLVELARKAGIQSDALHGTLSAYNAGVADGEDKLFLKEGEKRPVSTPPFYAIEVRASQFGITGAGLRIDAETCVYSNAEEPIPGLYAAGETTGGIHGDRYTGSGSSIAMAIVYGRIAGRSAATFAAQIE